MSSYYDVIILGSGLAGLTAALSLPQGCKIALVTKDTLDASSSYYAQGGIAAPLDNSDSIASHIADTLQAGAGLCREHSVNYVISQAKSAIEWLVKQAVPFTVDKTHSSGYHLTQEGGHSARRIIHAADVTGQAIITALTKQIRAQAHIDILEYHPAFDLLVSEDKKGKCCNGIAVIDIKKRQVRHIIAAHTILSTGGIGQIFHSTTNPSTINGEGIALAWEHGAQIINMEFIQFHPTSLYDPDSSSPYLISEALRGEGALLKRLDGTLFMSQYDPRAELAPRDIVARAIEAEIQRSGQPYVYLDISHRSVSFLQSHFPNIYQYCLKKRIDIAKMPIPVRPSAHYLCGGIEAAYRGITNIKGLYAIGETAHTGLHGANRLASNSLLECLVYAQAAGAYIGKQLSRQHVRVEFAFKTSSYKPLPLLPFNLVEIQYALRDTMTRYAGVIRNTLGLKKAQSRIKNWQAQIQPYVDDRRYFPDPLLYSLKHSLIVADLVIVSALSRHESRGVHTTLDYPYLLANAVESCLQKDKLR